MTQQPELTEEQSLRALDLLRGQGAIGLLFDDAFAILREVVQVTEGEIIASMEPARGLSAPHPQDLAATRWLLVVTSQQRDAFRHPTEGLKVSALESHGWDMDGVETFWSLDFLLSGALRGELVAGTREYFEQDVADLLRWLEVDAGLEFERTEGGGWVGRCPEVEQRLTTDDSWCVAMPMTNMSRLRGPLR